MARSTAKHTFAAAQEPWLDLAKFRRFCEESNVVIKDGQYHNRTDGGVHFELSCNDNTYDLKANYWDCRQPAWKEAIEWIEANGQINR